MKQPNGILQFYDDIEKQAVKGFFNKDLTFPILANNEKLLPFQLRRDVTGNSINVFKLIRQNGTEVDLIADEGNILPYTFDDFEQYIYNANIKLSETPTDGYYYIQIEDSVNVWYSDWFLLSSFPLSIITFGAYTNSYTNSYQQEQISSAQNNDYLRLLFGNQKDLGTKLYQYGYNDILILDERYGVSNIFKNSKEEINLSDNTGKEVINNVVSFEEFEVNFVTNSNEAKVLSRLTSLDNLTLLLQNGEEVTANEFDVEISDRDTDITKNVKITYRINYSDSETGNFTAA